MDSNFLLYTDYIYCKGFLNSYFDAKMCYIFVQSCFCSARLFKYICFVV